MGRNVAGYRGGVEKDKNRGAPLVGHQQAIVGNVDKNPLWGGDLRLRARYRRLRSDIGGGLQRATEAQNRTCGYHIQFAGRAVVDGVAPRRNYASADQYRDANDYR